MLNRGLDKVELLRIVEAVANEKSIDKEIVLESMESAIQKAALTKFGTENNIRVIIDRLSGEIKIQKVLDIVETIEDPSREEFERQWIANNDAREAAHARMVSNFDMSTIPRGNCEDCQRGVSCVGAVEGGPCSFVGTCTNCLRFRCCAGSAAGGPCSPEEDPADAAPRDEQFDRNWIAHHYAREAALERVAREDGMSTVRQGSCAECQRGGGCMEAA